MDIVAYVPTAVSVVTLAVLLFRFRTERRADAMSAGQNAATVVQLRKDLDDAIARISVLTDKARCSDMVIAEIKTDLKHIIKAIERLEQKIESRHPEVT